MLDHRRRFRMISVWFALGLLLVLAVGGLHAQPPAPPPEQPRILPSPPLPPGTPVPPSATPPLALTPAVPPVLRFQFKIDPATPLKDLLPAAPKVKSDAGPVLDGDLTQVPEVLFQAPMARDLSIVEGTRHTAHTIAKINHLNSVKTDRFMEALRAERLDLAGLPFAMGDACRTKGERSEQFALAVATVRRAMSRNRTVQTSVAAPNPPPPAPSAPASALSAPVSTSNGTTFTIVERIVESPNSATAFWDQYQTLCAEEDRSPARADRAHREHVTLARVAALMQVLAPEPPELRVGLVKYLAGVTHVESTRALAKLAIFSVEDEVRQAALEALKVRRERDYTEILLQGLRYPWPAVARHAGEAVVKLERTDLLPQLVELLGEPDPRAPVVKQVDQKKVQVVRELVRINHHRNCLLCHAPGNTGTVAPASLTAAVPIPGEALPTPSEGYRSSSPDVLVRVDVTYLRQDFSVRQAVADANPWPEMQRFDFLVRTRELTADQAEEYRQKLVAGGKGRLSPYQRAAVTALRDLTGQDAEPSAEAWRRLLELPQPPG